MDDNLHARLVGVITEALTDIESGKPVNIAIDISNSAVNIEFYVEGQKNSEHKYPFGAEVLGSAATVADQDEAPRELALGNMVRLRHGDRFLPNPGKIISMTTSLVTAPDYLVEYWLHSEPISKWFAAGYVEFFAEDANAAKQRDIDDDAAAALRHDVRQKAKAPVGDRGDPGPVEWDSNARLESVKNGGPFITPLAIGECLSGFSLIDNVAAAARAHGMTGTLTLYFSPNDKLAESDAEDIARP